MAIINMPFSIDNKIKKSVDILINDTIQQTKMLEDIIDEAPAVLSGYINFRKILRAHKRGLSLADSIKKYSIESCPPKLCPSEDCDITTCNECWHSFVKNYYEAVVPTNKKGSTEM